MRRLKLNLSGRNIRLHPDLVLAALALATLTCSLVALFIEGRRSGEWAKVCAYLLAGQLVVVITLAATWRLSGQ